MKIALIFSFSLASAWALPNSPRIVGGQIANAGEFPYSAAIYKSTPNGNFFCVGSLLSENWVITAGQCVDGAILFKILLGIIRLDETGEALQELATDTYALHPDYNPLTLANDIGLIKFRMPILFTSYVKKLHLPYAENYEGVIGQAYGWGHVSDADTELSNSLIWVDLQHLPDAECKLTYGNQIAQNMACFAGNYNQGTCIGDSGSPVTQYVSRAYIVVHAVASFFSGNGCESTDPSGFTLVFPYNEWIRNVTGPEV